MTAQHQAAPLPDSLARYIREQNESVMAERQRRERRRALLWLGIAVVCAAVGAAVGVAVGAWWAL